MAEGIVAHASRAHPASVLRGDRADCTGAAGAGLSWDVGAARELSPRREVARCPWDTRLREAGAEVVYCLARGAPKGPNLPRARLNHQDALFPGHGKATHSQTWAGEPAWLGVHEREKRLGAIRGEEVLAKKTTWTFYRFEVVRELRKMAIVSGLIDIVNYLVFSVSYATLQEMKAFKPLESHNYFTSGWMKGPSARGMSGGRTLMLCEDSFSDAAMAKTALLKLGARVPPPPGPILKIGGTASAPEALHVLRQRARRGAPARDRPRWETEAPACLVRGGGGKNEKSWDDEGREIGKGLLRGERATTDVRGGGGRAAGSGDGPVTWSGLRPRIRPSTATSPGCGLDEHRRDDRQAASREASFGRPRGLSPDPRRREPGPKSAAGSAGVSGAARWPVLPESPHFFESRIPRNLPRPLFVLTLPSPQRHRRQLGRPLATCPKAVSPCRGSEGDSARRGREDGRGPWGTRSGSHNLEVQETDIKDYLVGKTSFITREQFEAHKALDAHNYLTSGATSQAEDVGCSEGNAPREHCCSCGRRPAFRDAAVQADPDHAQVAPMPPAREDKAVGTDPRLGKKSVVAPEKPVLAPAAPIFLEAADSPESTDLEDSRDPLYVPSNEWSFVEDHIVTSDVPLHEERKFLVFESSLKELFTTCKTCYGPCKVSTVVNATRLTVRTHCPDEHVHVWDSMPCINGRPAGALLLSAAILFTGASPAKTLRVLDLMNVEVFCEKTFYNYQRTVLLQAVAQVWADEQWQLMDKLRDQPLDLAGDGRCDSPGFSAKYLTYSLYAAQANKILHFEQIQVGECEAVRNSGQMEKEGLIRSLEFVKGKDLTVRSLTTDRHRSIAKHMREQEAAILHYFDIWHVSKSIKKSLTAASKGKDCGVLALWSQPAVNHMYWVAAASQGKRRPSRGRMDKHHKACDQHPRRLPRTVYK
ncbi:hypothetical protein HPB47_013443, partial [Ixodes persulcatus]